MLGELARRRCGRAGAARRADASGDWGGNLKKEGEEKRAQNVSLTRVTASKGGCGRPTRARKSTHKGAGQAGRAGGGRRGQERAQARRARAGAGSGVAQRGAGKLKGKGGRGKTGMRRFSLFSPPSLAPSPPSPSSPSPPPCRGPACAAARARHPHTRTGARRRRARQAARRSAGRAAAWRRTKAADAHRGKSHTRGAERRKALCSTVAGRGFSSPASCAPATHRGRAAACAAAACAAAAGGVRGGGWEGRAGAGEGRRGRGRSVCRAAGRKHFLAPLRSPLLPLQSAVFSTAAWRRGTKWPRPPPAAGRGAPCARRPPARPAAPRRAARERQRRRGPHGRPRHGLWRGGRAVAVVDAERYTYIICTGRSHIGIRVQIM